VIITRQSTARTVIVGPVLDADGVAVEGGVIGYFKLSKNGAAPAAFDGSATLTHRHTGFYSLAATATDLNTVGSAQVTIDDTTNACPMLNITVIEEAVYDALYAASAAGYGTAQTGDSYALANGANGFVALKADTAAIKLKTDNLPSDPADASVIAARFDTLDTSVADLPTNAELATALSTADDATLAQVALVKTKTDLIPSDPADASDLAAAFATVNGTLSTMATYIDTEVAAIKAKTDLIPASPAATGDIPSAAANANATLAATVTELSAVPAASPTVAQALALLFMALRNKLDVTATTKEVHTDAGVVLGTKTLSDDGTTYSETKMA
jgi:hypothetical protein